MIDELALEQLLGELGEEITVPADGAERVVAELTTAVRPARLRSTSVNRLLLVAAVLVVIGGLAILMHGNGSSHAVTAAGLPSVAAPDIASSQVPSAAPAGNHGTKGALGPTGPQGVSPQGVIGPQGPAATGEFGAIGDPGSQSAQGATGPEGIAGSDGLQSLQGDQGVQGALAGPSKTASAPAKTTATTVPTQSPTAPIDGALIVKSGSLDLQVPHDTLRPTFNRITTTVVGLGGYIANQTANYNGSDPTGIISVRVPVNLFDKAVSEINGLPGVKVLGDNETGKDVTAQYVNVQAQITADTTEEQSILVLLSHASDLNDILNLRGQATAVQSTIDQLQGQINLLKNEASYSQLSITATEVIPAATKKAQAKAHHVAAKTGLSKSWSRATSGFASSIEWFIARSGGTLILFLVALLLVFGLRYLYPVLRRALL